MFTRKRIIAAAAVTGALALAAPVASAGATPASTARPTVAASTMDHGHGHWGRWHHGHHRDHHWGY